MALTEMLTNYTSRSTGTVSDQAAGDQSRYGAVTARNQGILHRFSAELLTSSLPMPQGLKDGAYNAIIMSSEQFFLHELLFSGIEHHGIPAF